MRAILSYWTESIILIPCGLLFEQEPICLSAMKGLGDSSALLVARMRAPFTAPATLLARDALPLAGRLPPGLAGLRFEDKSPSAKPSTFAQHACAAVM